MTAQAPPKTKNAEPETPVFVPPPVFVGDDVVWHHPGKTEGWVPAKVTRVMKNGSVALSTFRHDQPALGCGMNNVAYRHAPQEQGSVEYGNSAMYGVWDLTETEKVLRESNPKYASALEERFLADQRKRFPGAYKGA